MEQTKTIMMDGNGELPHLGNLLTRKLKEKNIPKVVIASRIGVSPQSINGYMNSKSFQFRTLWELAIALEYNFLADLMDNLPAKVVVNSQSKFQKIILAQAEEIADLKKENAIYKELLKR